MKKLLLAFVFALCPLASHAQEFPPSQVRIVVPFTPGGGTDVITRLVAQGLSDMWKVPVIIDNRVGAGGVIGSKWVAEQAPDGRTFLAVASAFGVRLAIDPKVPYSIEKDFVGVGQMARSPSFLVTSTQHGFKSLQDLVAHAKKQPEGIHYASAGVGSTAHMHSAAVAHLTGMKAEHVAYRGTPEAVNDAMTGRVLYCFAPGPNAIPLAKAGKLQILATTSDAGSAFMPGVPSLEKAGVAYEGDDWFGVFAPAGTPAAIRERFARDMQKVLEMPAVKERLAGLGATPAFMGSAEWDQFARAYVVRMRKLGDAVGIKPQ
ncbi:MAG TPA: tripartite tricarboxylate transporter substrate-binding protein [Burkholderiales bacterium]|nr:tripartite tricarboxylate transporter substrate-binding protein [Burkholderiales bacterium]